MDDSTIVGILIIFAVSIALGFGLYLRYRVKMQIQETVRFAIEKGNELDPELIERIMDPGPKRPRPPQDFRTRDLRRGVLALALAMAVAGIGFALPEEDMTRVFLAAAGLPAAIGLAYLVLWQFADRGGNGTT